MRRLPVWLLCVWAFVAGGAAPLIIGNLALSKSTATLKDLGAACDRRDAAYRDQISAQDALIAEMRRGIAVRDRVIASAQTRGPAEGAR